MKTVAALCVSKSSHYKKMENVDCFDIVRDVRTFSGNLPVVAHPPCRAWSAKCRHQAKPLPGEKELGPFCVEILEKNGGVLEHPAFSHLFQNCALPLPGKRSGNLWTIEVLQTWWGYQGTQKRTWLCFCGISPKDVVFPLTLRMGGNDDKIWSRLGKTKRSETCPALAEWLVDSVERNLVGVA